MTRGLIRYQQCGCFHFVTFSCYRRQPQHPVRRGLIEKPEDWQWSSFRHYATGVEGVVEIESQWTAARRGDRLPEHLRYREEAE